jgi:hypothetical protein
MKKIYTLLSLCLVQAATFAQVAFFEPTTYRGAFGDNASTRWTDTWTNWDPENTAYTGGSTVNVTADITANTTWTSGNTYILTKVIYVTSPAVLTIQPGTIIKGDASAVSGAALVIGRGAKIMAQGTAASPIVFTSSETVGNRAIGDWGGLIVLGAARVNSASGVAVIEGGLDAAKAEYGGNNDADNSGIIQYVRIEFGGYIFDVDKEINGMTMGGVGSGTTIDHVQVSYTNDDGFEWFGGKVNCKYIVSYKNLDDDFDTDFGYSGKVQFGLIIRDPFTADQSTGSTSEGFESDNDASGSTASPQTSAVFSNITCIGPYRGSTSNLIDAKFRRALRIRRNSAISVFNSVFTDWPTGLHIDGAASVTNANAGSLDFKNNVIAGVGTNKTLQITLVADLALLTNYSSSMQTFFASNDNDSLANATDVMFVSPYPADFQNPDYRLAVGSPLLTGADFTDPKLDFGVSVKENAGDNISMSIYPNPVNENSALYLNLKNAEKVTVKIYEITGKTVSTIKHEEMMQEGMNKIQISTAELKSGLYFATITAKGFSKTIKFAVSK